MSEAKTTSRGVAREPGHTPGKWHWDCDAIKGDPLGRTRYRVTTVGKTITQCYYSSDDPHCEADARLIAAAPDLLAALKGLLMRHNDGSSEGPWAEWDTAIEAITQAEGSPEEEATK